MRLLQPSSNIQLSRKSPDRFLTRALEIVRTGWGQPSIFNADLVVEELLRQGKSSPTRAGGTSGWRRARWQGSLHPDGVLQPPRCRDRVE
jgi:formate C-acetyltransferase